jgi:hypothetical protein
MCYRNIYEKANVITNVLDWNKNDNLEDGEVAGRSREADNLFSCYTGSYKHVNVGFQSKCWYHDFGENNSQNNQFDFMNVVCKEYVS